MDYYVYADGSYSTERRMGSWSYMIYTDIRYLDWMYNRSVFIASPTFAEDIAIGLACYNMLGRILTKKDRVIIHTDSMSSIEFFTGILNGEPYYVNNTLVNDAVKNVKLLAEKTNVEFFKVRGHKNKLSPNICVDRMARYCLRS